MSLEKKQAASAATLTAIDFTHDSRVRACVDELHTRFGADASGLIVSDVLDDAGHQYVNLVQKGGGVFGVALVGYTYVLEEMGIRFLRLAGTSAGAINTALMTVINAKEEKKSDQVLDAICKLDFFALVDGHPAARWIIRNFITQRNFTTKAKRWAFLVIGILAGLIIGDVVLMGLRSSYPALSVLAGVFFVLSGFWTLLIGVGIYYITNLLKRLKNAGFGINPGDYFYDWIKKQLLDNNVATVTALNNKASTCPPLHLRVPHPQGLKELGGDVTFIASELVTQNKIQFPAMCKLFREDIDTLQPAGFIRASMSIPVFFESYMITGIPAEAASIKKEWKDTFNELNPPRIARFVDGGILSNFPINLFYNPRISTPRLPNFGIDLNDSKPGDQQQNAFGWSLGGYFGRMFNTIRNYYDKDFLLKNKGYQRGVGSVDLSNDKFNWLNFFLSNEEKIELFALGAEAAKNFLLTFDWNAYKGDREKMQQELNMGAGNTPPPASNN
jgi:NTE family protein